MFGRRAASVVVEGRSAFVEAAGVPGVAEGQAVKVEVVAKFVAESAEEGAVTRDVFADGGAHPDANLIVAGLVVAEEFGGGVFADTQGAGSEDFDAAAGDGVEVGGGGEEEVAGAADVGRGSFGHCGFNGLRDFGQ